MRIDAVRAGIDRLDLDPVERGLLLTSLVEAADRVDSTCGVQMAYLKRWAARTANRARSCASRARSQGRPARWRAPTPTRSRPPSTAIDLAYVDPPYNQHSYLGNYHVWETLVRGDRPEHYGIACKRADCRTRKSAYNSRRAAWSALCDLIDGLATPWVIVSVSDEGFHDPADVERLLAERGHVGAIPVDFKRYVGAQIGIHNPAGERVGSVSHLRNTEWLFVCGPDRAAVDRAVAAALRELAPPAAGLILIDCGGTDERDAAGGMDGIGGGGPLGPRRRAAGCAGGSASQAVICGRRRNADAGVRSGGGRRKVGRQAPRWALCRGTAARLRAACATRSRRSIVPRDPLRGDQDGDARPARAARPDSARRWTRPARSRFGIGGFVSRSSSSGTHIHDGELVMRVPEARFNQARLAVERLGRADQRERRRPGRDPAVREPRTRASATSCRRSTRCGGSCSRRRRSRTRSASRACCRASSCRSRRSRAQLIYLRNRTALSTISIAVHEAGARPAPPAHASALWKAGERSLHTATAVVTSVIVGAGFVIPIAILVLLAVLIGRLAAPWAAPLAARRRGAAGAPSDEA